MSEPILLCMAIQAAVLSGDLNLPQERIELACALADELVDHSLDLELEPEILAALIHIESRWNPKAKSHVGACGLTQVMAKYVTQSCQDLLNPQVSLKAGAKALRFWLDHAGDSYEKGLACYNAGYRCEKVTAAEKYANDVLEVANCLRKKMDEIKREKAVQNRG